jgi:hypothetical protein
MKKIIIIFLICTISSCEYNDTDPKCGCNTNSKWGYATYDNFGGFSYNAMIGYDTVYKRNGWFIGVTIPNTNYRALLKVCNSGSPLIRSITDTIPRKNGIPIRGVPIVFSGKLKKLCNGESPCFGCSAYLPEILFAYVTIDSIKSN